MCLLCTHVSSPEEHCAYFKLDVFVWRRVKSGCGLDAGWRLTRVRWDAPISPRCVLCFSFCFIYRLMFIIPKRCLHAFNVQKHFMILHFYKCSVWVCRFKALLPKFQLHSYWSAVMTQARQSWWHSWTLCGLLNKGLTWSHHRMTTCCFYPWGRSLKSQQSWRWSWWRYLSLLVLLLTTWTGGSRWKQVCVERLFVETAQLAC